MNGSDRHRTTSSIGRWVWIGFVYPLCCVAPAGIYVASNLAGTRMSDGWGYFAIAWLFAFPLGVHLVDSARRPREPPESGSGERDE